MLAIRFIGMIKANFRGDSKGASVYYKRVFLFHDSEKENENRLEAMRLLGLAYLELNKWKLAEEIFEELRSCYVMVAYGSKPYSEAKGYNWGKHLWKERVTPRRRKHFRRRSYSGGKSMRREIRRLCEQ